MASPRRTSPQSGFNCVQHCARLHKTAVLLDTLLAGSEDAVDVQSYLSTAEKSVAALRLHIKALGPSDRERALKAVDSVRRRGICLLYREKVSSPADPFASPAGKGKARSREDESTSDSILALLESIQDWFAGVLEAAAFAASYTVDTSLVDAANLSKSIALKRLRETDLASHRQCSDRLTQCHQLLQMSSVSSALDSSKNEFLGTLSSVWYILGNRIYNARRSAQARHFLETACELAAEAKEYAAPTDASSEGLARKWEHLGLCLRAIPDAASAVVAYSSALSNTSEQQWKQLGERAARFGATTAFSEKPLASLINIAVSIAEVAAFDLDRHEGVDLISAVGSAPIDAQAILLESTATSLKTFLHREGCIQSITALLERCSQLLSDELYPIRLARVKIAQAEVAVAQRDISACESLLTEAGELLQRPELGLDAELRSLASGYLATAALLRILGYQQRVADISTTCLPALAQAACKTLYPLLGMTKGVPVDEMVPSRSSRSTKAPTPQTPKRRTLELEDGDVGSSASAKHLTSSLHLVVDDPVHLAELLEAARECAHAFGHVLAALELTKALRRLYRLTSDGSDPSHNFTRCSAMLALQYMALGRMTRASSVLKSCALDLDHGRMSPETLFICSLANAEHQARMKSLGSAAHHYQQALDAAKEFEAPQKGSSWTRCKAKVKMMECQAVAALAFADHRIVQGNLVEAISAALAGMKSLMRAVFLVKKYAAWDEEMSSNEPSIDNAPGSIELLQTFWSLSRQLISAATHLSRLYALRGSAKDAEMFATEALDLATPLGLSLTSAQVLIHRADIRSKMLQTSAALVDLDRASSIINNLPTPEAIAHVLIRGQELSRVSRADALAALLAGHGILKTLDTAFAEVEAALPSPAPARRISTISEDGKAVSRRVSAPQKSAGVLPEIHARLLRLHAWLLYQLNNEAEAKRLIEEAALYEHSMEGAHEGAVLRARMAMRMAKQNLSQQRSLNALVDASLSIPLVTGTTKPVKAATTSLSALQAAQQYFKQLKGGDEGIPAMLLAREAEASSVSADLLTYNLGKEGVEPHLLQLSLLRGTAIGLEREYEEAISMKLRSSEKAETPDWWSLEPQVKIKTPPRARKTRKLDPRHSPELGGDESEEDDPFANPNTALWKRIAEKGRDKALADLPEHWTVVSISWSQEQNSLLISRQDGMQSPMIFSIPIDRRSRHEGEDHQETFEAVVDAIKEIVTTSNTRVHAAKDLQGMDARKAWWTERRALDQRLGEILGVIESNWLGCFKVSIQARISYSSNC